MPVYQLDNEPVFPYPDLASASGLLAIGGDLSEERLIQAYAHGIFPWYSEGDPIMWWSPDPRMVLDLRDFKVSKSLRRLVQQKVFEVSFDACFREVIEACSQVPRKGQPGTWITHEMMDAYTKLHHRGLAHSVEVFSAGRLAGGLYGVSLGKAFFGESMFHHRRDASKVALYHLVERLRKWDFRFIDAQVETEHMASFGAENISRREFLEQLRLAVNEPTQAGKW